MLRLRKNPTADGHEFTQIFYFMFIRGSILLPFAMRLMPSADSAAGSFQGPNGPYIVQAV